MSKLWIADSGSTKTDWRFCENGTELLRLTTQGINPVYQTGEEITDIVTQELNKPTNEYLSPPLYFYGAGIIDAAKAKILQNALSPLFTGSISAYSDMVGAARGLCGHSAGIVSILGTGSNSCFYDGNKIRHNVSPLGFILGDEGSGAVIGKLFIGDLLKNQLSEELKQHFLETHQLTVSDIIDRVYRQPFPNRFLASFAPYIVELMHRNSKVRTLIENTIEALFTRNLLQYETNRYPIHFAGSIAYALREVLLLTAAKYNVQTGTIAASPMKGLIQYHAS